MPINRRDFMKVCIGTVAGLGVSRMFHPDIIQALANSVSGSSSPVIWLQGQSCGGCTASLLTNSHPSIIELLTRIIDMEYHPALMTESTGLISRLHSLANSRKGEYLLAIEGSIPTANERYCVTGSDYQQDYSLQDTVRTLAPSAAAILAVGSCAAYGGIPAAEGGVTAALSVRRFLDQHKLSTPLIAIPGCAPHPDWIVGTLSLTLEAIRLDGTRKGIESIRNKLDMHERLKAYYGTRIHEKCSFLPQYNQGNIASSFAEIQKCRYNLGCKGPSTMADCASRKWNNAANWCVENALCVGCVEPDFPGGKYPFYTI